MKKVSADNVLPKSCPGPTVLRAFAKGKLADERTAAVERHLTECSLCLDALEGADQDEDSFEEYLRNFDESLCEETGYQRLLTALDAPDDRGAAPSTLSESEEPSAPFSLGSYRLSRRLGRGATGTVYLAQHEKLNSWVALKLLSPRRQATAAALGQFEQEMKSIGQLDEHPNVVRARDAGQIDEHHFLVMDLVDGLDVDHLLRRHGPLGIPEACEIARQAALGLAHAHTHGLIHRDVKPGNLMLTRKGVVKILDLGLASYSGLGGQETQVAGTVDYMAPEQWNGRSHLDRRVDVYALGCTLFKMLVGYAPFARVAATMGAKRHAHYHSAPPIVSEMRADVPLELSAAIERMLKKSPSERVASCEEAASLLEPFVAGADLSRLVRDALAESVDTCGNLADPTWAERATRRIRRAAVSRRAWLLAGASAATCGGAAAWFSRTPKYRVLLAAAPQNLVWNYNSFRDLLKIHTTDPALFALNAAKDNRAELAYHIARHDEHVTAGVFFDYNASTPDGWRTETFCTVVVGNADNAENALISFVRYRVTYTPDELVVWSHDELATIMLPNMPRRLPPGLLRLAFSNGALTTASYNGKHLPTIASAASESAQPDAKQTARGVFCTAGAVTFRGA